MSVSNEQTFTSGDTTYAFAVDSSGCLSDTLHLELTERDKPLIDQFFAPFYHCAGDSSEIQLTGFNLFDAAWEDGHVGLSHFVQGSHSYHVVGEDMEGCKTDTAWIQIVENSLPTVPVLSYSYDSIIATDGYNNYDWSFNSNFLVSTGDDSVLVVLQNGNYTVTITDMNGCKNVSLPFSYGSAEVFTFDNITFSLYPNPTNGIFQISNTNFVIGEVLLSDASGKVVERLKVSKNNQKVDISHLPNGIYFAVLETAENRFVQKIVLNK